MGMAFVRDRFLRGQNVLLRYVTASLLLAVGAQITVPLGVVPFTLQTCVLFLLAHKNGALHTMNVVFLYILEGLLGAPVFAGFSSGFPVLFGPTGGYIWGFIPAVFVYGKCVSCVKNSFWNTVFGLFFGLVTLYALGYLQLASFVGFSEAYRCGVCLFLLPEMLKMSFTVSCCFCMNKRNG